MYMHGTFRVSNGEFHYYPRMLLSAVNTMS